MARVQNDIIDTINAILSAREIDAASMQLYDCVGAIAKHDKQIRALAEYIVKALPIKLQYVLDANIVNDNVYINGQLYCTVNYSTDTGIFTCTLADGTPLNVLANAGTLSIIDNGFVINGLAIGTLLTVSIQS